MNIQIIRQCYWCNAHVGGMLTKLAWSNVHAYVRENLQYASYRISASARLGLKRGEMPSDAVQVLELNAPKQYWEVIAQEVRQLDGLHRKVVRARFSFKWAEAQFTRRADDAN